MSAEPEPGMFGQLRLLASELVSRSSLARAAGLTFGGKRDLYETLGYARSLTARELRGRYDRGDIAARVVDVYPKETWREGPELIEDEDPDIITPFEEAFTRLSERLSLWPLMKRADVLAGLGKHSVLLIGAAGKLEEELPRLSGEEAILFFAPYGEEEATIEQYVEDPADARFGLPSFYKLTRSGAKRGLDRKVHWTRVVHFADNLLDDRVTGKSILERIWNRLDDLDKVVGGGSEAFWLRVHQGLVFSIDKDVKVETDAMAKFKDQSEEFAHGMRRNLAARGLSVEAISSDVANFSNPATALLEIIAGAVGVPQRMLLGSERGELASSQDKDSWDDRVADRRREYAEPIIRDFVARLQAAKAMPEVEYAIRWPDYEELDQKGKAEVATAWAGLNSKAGETVVTGAEIRDRVLDLPPLEEVDQMPPPPEGENPDEPPVEDEPVDEERQAVIRSAKKFRVLRALRKRRR